MNAAAKSPQPWPSPTPSRQEAIRLRAEEIYVRNGGIPGRDTENWAQAEREILRGSPEAFCRKAIVVKVDGAQYIGEYSAESSQGYVPGEFGPGASVSVRFHGDRMFLLRPNGKVLETTLVKKIE
jgi:hypothetical protein